MLCIGQLQIVETDTGTISRIEIRDVKVCSALVLISKTVAHTILLGPWTKEEEDELTKIVTEMTVEQGKDVDNDIFWGVVSKRMGGKRGRQQCRIKW